MSIAPGREDHREGEKLALERVETEAQRLEREGAEENGVPRLTEDHLGDRVAIPVPEEGDSAPARDAGRVRQAELPLPARLHAEPREDLPRHHGVDRSGIDQELELLGDVGGGEVRHLHADAGEPHAPNNSGRRGGLPGSSTSWGGTRRDDTRRGPNQPTAQGQRVHASQRWNAFFTVGVRRVRL